MVIFHPLLILMYAIFMVQTGYLLVEIEDEEDGDIVDGLSNQYDRYKELTSLGKYCVTCNVQPMYDAIS